LKIQVSDAGGQSWGSFLVWVERGIVSQNFSEIEKPLVVAVKIPELSSIVDLSLLDVDVVECRPSCWNQERPTGH